MQSVDKRWMKSIINLATSVPYETHLTPHHPNTATLQQAFSHCERITADNSKSFHLASSLLTAEKRQAVRALYAFCRTVDDIADLSPDSDSAYRDLMQWRATCNGDIRAANSPVMTAWLNTCMEYNIPNIYVEQLLDTLLQDLHQHRYQTFDELALYSYGVASTVGLMSMRIIGYDSEDAIHYAILLGIALQLTNILRDVHEDWQRGRIYLPLEELHAFGLDESAIAAATVTPEWRAFMQFQIARARDLYREALPGITYLHPAGRRAVSSAAVFYAAILNDIEQHDYDVFSRRAYVSKWGKIRRLPALMMGHTRI